MSSRFEKYASAYVRWQRLVNVVFGYFPRATMPVMRHESTRKRQLPESVLGTTKGKILVTLCWKRQTVSELGSVVTRGSALAAE